MPGSETLNQRLHEISGGTVLDIATGKGDFAARMAENLRDYDHILGIDLQHDRLVQAVAKHDYANLSFVRMDASRIALADRSVDTLAMAYSFHHMDDVAPTFREIKRVTRPGAAIMFVECYRYDDRDQPIGVQLHHWWAAIDRRAGVTHNDTWTRAEILERVNQLNLSDMTVFDIDLVQDELDSAEEREQIERVFDEYPHRIAGHPDYERLKEEGERLRQALREQGLSWSPDVVIIGRR